MEVNVQSKDIVTTQTVSKIKIDDIKVNLNSSARITVQLLNEDGGLVGVEFVNMVGPDYDNWGSDDQYLVNFVFTKLGLVGE